MRAPRRGRAVLTAGALTCLLAGCSSPLFDYLGTTNTKPPLPGTRISVLTLKNQIEPDPRIQDLQVRLPRPVENEDWPQSGGGPSHAMQHLALGPDPKIAWRSSIGDGSGGYRRLLAQPIVADGTVYALDALGSVAALSLDNGRLLWRFGLRPEAEEEGGHGGGLAFEQGVLYVATGYGEVVALVAENGNELWRQRLGVPIRAAPTVAENRVFVITSENKVFALDGEGGHRLWQHEGLPENAGIIGAASAAVEGGIVIVPYSSGELYGLRADNGRLVWSETLTRPASAALLTAFSNINGHPVVADNQVFAVSHAGRMVALNTRTGARVWDQSVGGTETPWLAGDFLFLITNDAELICLWRRDGRVRWVLPLQRYDNAERRTGFIQWSGPVLAGDRLIVVSSRGEALAVSPYSGEAIGYIRISAGAFLAPVVAENNLVILTDTGDLLALR